MKKGSKGGLQYHRKKEECGILIKGKLRINYSTDSKKLKSKIIKPGETFYFPTYFYSYLGQQPKDYLKQE